MFFYSCIVTGEITLFGSICAENYDKVCTPDLLTPWSRVLLQKLIGSQLVKFPTFYGTQMFITAVKSAHHLSQS